MKHITLLVLAILLLSIDSFSQLVERIGSLPEFLRKHIIETSYNEDGISLDDIKGSPFENDEFQMGKLFTLKGEKYENIPMRFNVFNNEVEFKAPKGKIFAISEPGLFKYIIIGSNKYCYTDYPHGISYKKAFLEIHVEGKASLFSLGKIVFIDEKPAKPYKDPEPSTFKRMNDEFYIKIGEQPINNVSSKKELISMFGESGNKIKRFIKSEKIKITKVKDLKKLAEFYNLSAN